MEYEIATTYNNSTSESGPVVALGILLMAIAITLVFYVVFSFIYSQLLKKAGVKGWKAWIPIYNGWVFNEIGGQAGWLVFIPIANTIFQIIAAYNIGLKLQKPGAFWLLYFFITPIWMILLAFDSSKWNESAGSPRRDTPDFPVEPTAPITQS